MLSSIYDTVLQLHPLIQRFEDHVKHSTSKEEEQDTRLANHGDRIGSAEMRITTIEAERRAEEKTTSEQNSDKRSKRPNWAAIAGFGIAAYLAVRDSIVEFIN